MNLVDNRLFIAAAAAIVGSILSLIVQRFLGRRGLLTYNVHHSRVGLSGDDAVFGSVQVSWNEKPVPNLYSSTIELRNESLTDYVDVTLSVFSSDTFLLTERTEIVGTIRTLKWTEDYAKRLEITDGSSPTPEQHSLYDSRRDYLIPILNRSQVVRITFLNVAKESRQPTIWLDVLHKGAILRFRVPPQQYMGVSHGTAVAVGSILGLVVFAVVALYVSQAWVAAAVSMLYGFLVILPGALTVRLWRWIREAIAG